MSRKSVPFSVPDGAGRSRRAPDVIEAHTDEWVSDRNSGTKDDARRPSPTLLLDLAAERGLAEAVALSMLAPMAIGWFWMMNAMSGRARF